jgi:hypothetical protein
MSFSEDYKKFLKTVYDPQEHDECVRNKSFRPRFSAVPEESNLENLKVGLMFEKANYNGDPSSEEWPSPNDRSFDDLIKYNREYHCGMKEWIQGYSTRKKVKDTLTQNIDVSSSLKDVYMTDYHKCENECKSKEFFKEEIKVVSDHLDLMILFGNQAKNAFVDSSVELAEEPNSENADISYNDGISKIHGYLFKSGKYDLYLLPLKFINLASHSIRGVYTEYMEHGLEEYTSLE